MRYFNGRIIDFLCYHGTWLWCWLQWCLRRLQMSMFLIKTIYALDKRQQKDFSSVAFPLNCPVTQGLISFRINVYIGSCSYWPKLTVRLHPGAHSSEDITENAETLTAKVILLKNKTPVFIKNFRFYVCVKNLPLKHKPTEYFSIGQIW